MDIFTIAVKCIFILYSFLWIYDFTNRDVHGGDQLKLVDVFYFEINSIRAYLITIYILIDNAVLKQTILKVDNKFWGQYKS